MDPSRWLYDSIIMTASGNPGIYGLVSVSRYVMVKEEEKITL
jgi:hypothetical protein